MPEMCHVCNEMTDLSFLRRVKEEGTDAAVYQCQKCKSFLVRGAMTEKHMRGMTVGWDVPWHVDEERNLFRCNYNNLGLKFPLDKGWTCDKCFRGCIYTTHLGKGTLTYNRRRT